MAFKNSFITCKILSWILIKCIQKQLHGYNECNCTCSKTVSYLVHLNNRIDGLFCQTSSWLSTPELIWTRGTRQSTKMPPHGLSWTCLRIWRAHCLCLAVRQINSSYPNGGFQLQRQQVLFGSFWRHLDTNSGRQDLRQESGRELDYAPSRRPFRISLPSFFLLQNVSVTKT